ncbi:MAG TPA: phosphatase [Actinomycetota bacterium]|nr:phosphatase [Actinomycetota bacterium]
MPQERTLGKGGDPQLWRPGRFSDQELAEALVRAAIAGPVASHDRANVLWRIGRLVDGDPEERFGLSGLPALTAAEILALIAAETGFDADPTLQVGEVSIDPARLLQALKEAGVRLADAAKKGERVLLATGHPGTLLLFYGAVADLLRENGAKLLTPMEGARSSDLMHIGEIAYVDDVGVFATMGGPIHTHGPEPMERMLEEAEPDLAFADHGFAGAAIQAGVETIAIADVNDPAPIVAKAQGRTNLVIVMDDGRRRKDYWPAYQAMAAGFGSS